MVGRYALGVSALLLVAAYLVMSTTMVGPPTYQKTVWIVPSGAAYANELVEINDTKLVFNESGVYLKIVFTAKKEAWIDAIYYNAPLWLVSAPSATVGYDAEQALLYLEKYVPKIPVKKWYKPGTYQITVKYSDKPVALKVDKKDDGTLYAIINVPVSDSKYKTYYYKLDKLVNTSWTVHRVLYMKLELPKGVTAIYVDAGNPRPWVWAGTGLGYVTHLYRDAKQVLYGRCRNASDIYEAGEAVSEYMRQLITAGLNVSPEQVFAHYWYRSGRPELEPISKPAILLAQKGDCQRGASAPTCMLPPRILKTAMEKALREPVVSAVITMHEHKVVGVGKIANTTVYIVEETVHTVRASPVNVEDLGVSTRLYAVLAAKPPANSPTWSYINLPWFKVVLVARPSPYGDPYLAALIATPSLPAPSTTP